LPLYLLAETNPNAFTNDNLPLLPPALGSFSTDLFLVYVKNPSSPDFHHQDRGECDDPHP